MKRLLVIFALIVSFASYATAQAKAEIKFEKTSYSFGEFSESTPIVSAEFKFTNVGDAPLVIHQAIASCGCTVPEYTKEPIAPGETGIIKVTYNGTGRYPGYFKKSITLRTNSKTEMIRLYIDGDMKAKSAE